MNRKTSYTLLLISFFLLLGIGISFAGDWVRPLSDDGDEIFYIDVQNVLNNTSYYNLTIVNGSNTYFLVAEDTRYMLLEGEFE
jgi:hypothetical protein